MTLGKIQNVLYGIAGMSACLYASAVFFGLHDYLMGPMFVIGFIDRAVYTIKNLFEI